MEKKLRLSGYDYSENGAYFITLCTWRRNHLLSRPTDVPYPHATQLVPRIVASLKRFSNRDVGFDLWQESYHDHIIRTEQDFLDIWNYIAGNPSRWSEDIYYEP